MFRLGYVRFAYMFTRDVCWASAAIGAAGARWSGQVMSAAASHSYTYLYIGVRLRCASVWPGVE